MINCYVPSKNRAAQLELLLYSIRTNAPDLLKLNVVYTYTNDNFKAGYDKLIKDNNSENDITFTLEENGQKNFYEFLNSNKDQVVGLFTDDCIVYRPLKISDVHIENILSNDVWCFSLRLGLNITVVDYVMNKPCPQPSNIIFVRFFDEEDRVIDNGIEWN